MTLVDRTRVIVVLAAAGLVWSLGTARAQSAEAEALFRNGRELIKHGKIAAGCDKLVASERLETSVGTLLNLGDCHEKLGKLASAWAAFRMAFAMAKRAGGDDKRQAEAARRAVQLEPRLSSLEIEVTDRVDGLVVRRNDEIVDGAEWNTALPLDPGNYTIAAAAPGYQAWRTTVTVGPGAERQVVVVPRFARAPAVNEPVAARLPGPRGPPVAQPAVMTAHHAGSSSTTRTLSVVLSLAGAGALGAGIYFGVHANDLQDRSDRRCPLAVCADPEGLKLNDQAQISARRANVFYMVSGGMLAASMVLWLAGKPDEARVVPTAGDHLFGIAMKGRF